MGRVYRARDTELDEVVALKVLQREFVSSPEMVERFRREVKLARRVTHPNVARMFDIGEHRGEKFLTMELIDGAPLLSKGEPSLSDALAIATAICAGLGAAHAVGVVHRDLKPDNVLRGKDGRVVITDFGIAAATDRHKTLGGVVGTPAYMAPEQLEGGAIDGRTDLFALGVLLYRLATGTLPWQETEPFATAMARLQRPAPDPRTRRAELPESLSHLLLRALARRPEDRPASAAEFAATLAAIELHTVSPLEHADTLAGSLLLGESSAPSSPPVRNVPPGVSSQRPLPHLSSSAAKTPHAVSGHPGIGPSAKTLAVLPIRNLGSAEDAYLAEALTEEFIDTLSMTAGLRVRPRGSVAMLKTSDIDPREAGQRLGVQLVIEGTLRRSGSAVRISARLISAADGFQIWARRFERPAGELLQVGDEVIAAIAEALMVTPAVSLGPGTQDPQALDLYLRARYAYNQSDGLDVDRAIGLYQQAVALAPEDPAILAGYAMACARGWFFGFAGTEERASEIAERLMRIIPHRAEPYMIRASLFFQKSDMAAVADGLQWALALSPTMSEPYALLGRALLETGPLEDGLRVLRHAQALDPTLKTQLPFDVARAYALLGQWEEADRIISSHATNRRSLILRIRLCMWRRDQLQARQLMQHPDIQAGHLPVGVDMLRVVGGEVTDVNQAMSSTFIQRWVGSTRNSVYGFQLRTELALSLDHLPAAEHQLTEAVAAGLADLMWLQRCPLLGPLRQLPSYASLEAQVQQRASHMVQVLRTVSFRDDLIGTASPG
jgi:serine/threonine-protein kinase